MRRITDQPFESIWAETDDITAMAREFESKGGITLQDHEERQLWLIQGHLVTLVRIAPQNHPAAKITKSNRLRTLLTALGLGIIIGLFAYTFVGTLLFMSMRN